MMAEDIYSIYAVKYAHHDRKATENFLGGDPHDVAMPLDYFVWVLEGRSEYIIVDTGFDDVAAQERGRRIYRPLQEGLSAIGVVPENVRDVIITHMHYDHAGNHGIFPNATFHLQDREMAYCTGRYMCHDPLQAPYKVDDVTFMVHQVFEHRVRFYDGDAELRPGITLHHVGGHSDGLQVVRVRTRRGWVVLASDATHFYANIEQRRPFPVVYDVGGMLEGYERVYELADSSDHVIPGHDPDVLRRYPTLRQGMEDWIVRLD